MDESPMDRQSRMRRIARGRFAAILVVGFNVAVVTLTMVGICSRTIFKLEFTGNEVRPVNHTKVDFNVTNHTYINQTTHEEEWTILNETTLVPGPTTMETSSTSQKWNVGFWNGDYCTNDRDGEHCEKMSLTALTSDASELFLEKAGTMAILTAVAGVLAIVMAVLEIAKRGNELFPAGVVGASVLSAAFGGICLDMLVVLKTSFDSVKFRAENKDSKLSVVSALFGASPAPDVEHGYSFIVFVTGASVAGLSMIVYIARRYCGCVCCVRPKYDDESESLPATSPRGDYQSYGTEPTHNTKSSQKKSQVRRSEVEAI